LGAAKENLGGQEMSDKQSLKRTKTLAEIKQTNPVSATLFMLIILAGALASAVTGQFASEAFPLWFTLSFVPALYVLFALKIANQWEKAIVLRFGKFNRVAGPGLFWIIPIVETISTWVDQRVMVTPFSAQKTLTKDTVPVDVDAVLFWVVWDAQKAALEVENYRVAVDWAAQTALRDIIGKMMLADILVGRSVIDKELQQIIDQRTTPWGITVQSVEIRDIVIPQDLEDAMSRQAQAERERQARVILGESEKQIAASFAEAARAYADNPTALHLRAMNMLFEGLKEKGALIIVPSSAVDTMNLGGLSGLTALGTQVSNTPSNK
jgi:regulator of protease activity HflC (stomatin/prohibitin superfamily)